MKAENRPIPAPAFDPASDSLIKKHLTPELWARLSPLKTNSGFTLEKAIQSGLEHTDSSIGLYAGDAQSYTLFAPLFDPIIREYHNCAPVSGPEPDFDPVDLPDPDPSMRFIRSTRIRVARSLEGFSFPCHITALDRQALEQAVAPVFENLPPPLAGRYIRLWQESETRVRNLIKQGLAFKKGDRFQEAAGMNRDFPRARAVFFSQDLEFRAWVNEEDHLRLISLARGADLSRVYNRLCLALETLEKDLVFSRRPAYGFLNSCPTNIGTAMRASVHIRLTNLEKTPARLMALAREHQLQIRGSSGEKTRIKDALFDISNQTRLGLGANAIIARLYKGINALIKAEKTA